MAEAMSKQVAWERIDKAFCFHETELDLSGWALEELAPETGKLVWREKLNLESARIKSLPKDIGQLKNLTELDLLDNRLVNNCAIEVSPAKAPSLAENRVDVGPLVGLWYPAVTIMMNG